MIPDKEPYTTGEKSLTRKEAESVILSAKSSEEKILVLIGFTLGLRRDDLVRIEIQNIDTKTRMLSYHQKKRGNRVKTVPLSDRLNHELELYISEHTKEGQKYLFPPRQETRNCGYMSSKTAYNIFNNLCKEAGIRTPIPIHAMRSTCIKLKQQAGWTVEQVAALIGDTVETVLDHYATPSFGELAQLMKDKGGL